MRILQVIPTIAPDGAQRMVANLCHHLRRAGHDVAVATLFSPTGLSLGGELRDDGVEVHELGKRMGIDLRMIPRLARVVAGFQPDVIHTHLYVLKYLLPVLDGRRRRSTVHTVHNLAEREGTRGDEWVQWAAFRCGVVPVAIGRAVADSMQRLYGVPARCTIPNGIPTARYASRPGAREALRRELAIPADAPVFVMVGRFVEQKDHATLIRAHASQRLRELSAHLLLAGDGPLREDTERLARDLGAGDRTHFLGLRGDVPAVLAAADVFVLPSRYEGHPLAVMEAMAAGKPVVATDVGCVPENVSSDVGRLVPPGDVAALEAALAELGSDLALSRALGAAALRRAREQFDSSVMANAYERLYDELREAGQRRLVSRPS